MQDPDVELIDHSLELEEKLSHQIKGWKAQKICGIIILTIIVVTAAGLFGGWPLSWKTVEKTEMTVQYETFSRIEKEMDISITLNGAEAMEVATPLRYLRPFQVRQRL